MRIADFLDISFIAVVLYFGLAWLKQQASRSLAIAIGIAMVLYILARQTDMYLTSQLFSAGLTAILVALVLIFHTDIRRMFERLATMKFFNTKHGLIASNYTVDILTESIAKLADDRVGALIVIKGMEPLERQIRGGVLLNGKISSPLLYGIFNTQSPTHDGAVIVEGESLERYGVYLPLSQNVVEGGRAGTRHAAALGLSERCDAFIIVVSEERGTICIAQQGKLDKLDSPVTLKTRLTAFYQSVHPSQSSNRKMQWLTKNPGLKIAALAIAFGLWWFFAHRVATIHRTFSVPIECRNVPADFIIDDPGLAEARVSLSGPERNFSFDPITLAVALDLSELRDGTVDIPISERSLQNKPSGLLVTQILPHSIKIKAYRMTEIDIPVKLVTSGAFLKDMAKAKIALSPLIIPVMVPKTRRFDITEIKTEPLVLPDIKHPGDVKLSLICPDHCQFLEKGPNAVIARIDTRQ